MHHHLRPAVVLFALFTVLTGLAYPLAITGLAQWLFPHQANGSLIRKDGRVIGSSLIGQHFTAEGYFHGRPSATTGASPDDPGKTVPAPYNAAGSSGSNLGPTARILLDRIRTDRVRLQAENPGQPVPAELLTTSASGLDPQISLATALYQVPRIARARGLKQEQLDRMVKSHVQGRWLGLLGEPAVNVLELNLALDALARP